MHESVPSGVGREVTSTVSSSEEMHGSPTYHHLTALSNPCGHMEQMEDQLVSP